MTAHTASAPDLLAENDRLKEVNADLLAFAKEAEEYLSCIALESDVPDPEVCANPCDDKCGNKLCDVNGCIKYRIRFARAAIAKATGGAP